MVLLMANTAPQSSWRIGELAGATGLTSRALRHYDAIGLVVPKRAESGQRRYRERDVRRLYQVLALRQLGLPLHEIADALDSRGFDVRGLVRRQLDQLDHRGENLERLRRRVAGILDVLERRSEPSVDDLLDAIGVMSSMETDEFVRDGLEALNRGDMHAIAAMFDPDVEWRAVRSGPWDCHDRGDVLRTLGDVVENRPFALEEVVRAGDRLAISARDRDGRAGWCMLTLRDGKIVRMEDQPDRQHALQAIQVP